jgi:hypothetical protein
MLEADNYNLAIRRAKREYSALCIQKATKQQELDLILGQIGDQRD